MPPAVGALVMSLEHHHCGHQRPNAAAHVIDTSFSENWRPVSDGQYPPNGLLRVRQIALFAMVLTVMI